MSLKHNCKESAAKLGNLLVSKKLTLSTAESCTGGMIGSVVTSVSGSSEWFRGGIIAYDNAVKISFLGVPESIIGEYGAVSRECVKEMARFAAQKLGTECSIAVSGIAGPVGGTEQKPVGLVFIAVYCIGKISVFKYNFSGDRENVREQTVYKGLNNLIRVVEGL